MKKILVAFMAVLLAFDASAQFGIVGGITTAETRIRDVDVRAATMYHWGVCYKLPLVFGFTFQPELLYNSKGGRMGEVQLLDESVATVDTVTGYVEIGGQLQLGPNLEMARPYVFVEPFAGYVLKQLQTVDIAAVISEFTAGQDYFWNDIKRFEYGVAFGAGIEVIGHVQVSAKYFWNLSPLYDPDGTINSDIIKRITEIVKNNNAGGIEITAAIVF